MLPVTLQRCLQTDYNCYGEGAKAALSALTTVSVAWHNGIFSSDLSICWARWGKWYFFTLSIEAFLFYHIHCYLRQSWHFFSSCLLILFFFLSIASALVPAVFVGKFEEIGLPYPLNRPFSWKTSRNSLTCLRSLCSVAVMFSKYKT